MSRLLLFQRLKNIRDLGGMKTRQGKSIRSGMLIRSGHLAGLCASDQETLGNLVDVIIDLRTGKEREENPDTFLEGVSFVTIPILDSLTEGITREEEADQRAFLRYLTEPEQAHEYMCGMYRGFVQGKAMEGYRRFFACLMESGQKSVLWHCTAGKDRAGIASVLIEEILGISREDIKADYLKTNEYLEGDILELTEFIKKKAGVVDRRADEALRYLFGADEAYISTYYSAVDETYGSFGNMIREGLGLTEQDISLLRERYLEPVRV